MTRLSCLKPFRNIRGEIQQNEVELMPELDLNTLHCSSSQYITPIWKQTNTETKIPKAESMPKKEKDGIRRQEFTQLHLLELPLH